MTKDSRYLLFLNIDKRYFHEARSIFGQCKKYLLFVDRNKKLLFVDKDKRCLFFRNNEKKF